MAGAHVCTESWSGNGLELQANFAFSRLLCSSWEIKHTGCNLVVDCSLNIHQDYRRSFHITEGQVGQKTKIPLCWFLSVVEEKCKYGNLFCAEFIQQSLLCKVTCV